MLVTLHSVASYKPVLVREKHGSAVTCFQVGPSFVFSECYTGFALFCTSYDYTMFQIIMVLYSTKLDMFAPSKKYKSSHFYPSLLVWWCFFHLVKSDWFALLKLKW